MNKTINPTDLKQLLEVDATIQLVDVRGADEFASGHIPRAINIPLEQLEGRMEDLGGRMVILCRTDRRASMACEMLRAHRADLTLLEGGTQAWIKAGLPVTSPASRARWSLERQVRFAAGILVLFGTLLSLFAHANWIYLAVIVGTGLTFAGATDLCFMANFLAKLPWNRVPRRNLP